MNKKKRMIRVKEYSQLTGIVTQVIHRRINDGEMKFELIGGTRHVEYPADDLIKFKPVEKK